MDTILAIAWSSPLDLDHSSRSPAIPRGLVALRRGFPATLPTSRSSLPLLARSRIWLLGRSRIWLWSRDFSGFSKFSVWEGPENLGGPGEMKRFSILLFSRFPPWAPPNQPQNLPKPTPYRPEPPLTLGIATPTPPLTFGFVTPTPYFTFGVF